MSDLDRVDEKSAAEAACAVDANLSPRWRRLAKLENYVDGTQYAGMQHWIWPTNPDTPLPERGPHIVDPIVKKAIASYLDLLVGEGRWPTVKVQSEDEGESFDKAMAFSEDERETVEPFLPQLCEHARLRTVAGEALRSSMSSGTIVTTLGAKRGKLVAENLSAKWCSPAWSERNPDELTQVEVRYPYTEQVWDAAERRWKTKAKLYRRVIDVQYDRAYDPVDAPKDGGEPSWTEKPVGMGTVKHGYGFVPAVWYAFDRQLGPQVDRDGHAIHAELIDELDGLNRACSQYDRAALYCGDPQIVEAGVAPEYNPSAMGRPATGIATFEKESPAAKEAHARWNTGMGAAGGNVRKKGPGVVWRYPDASVRVEMLTLSKDDIEAIAANRDDLRTTIADALNWVREREPGSPGGGIRFSGLSGEALKWMYQKQLSRCDSYRDDFADGWLLPLIRLALRIVLSHANDTTRGALYLPGVDKVAPLLGRFYRDVEGAEGAQWFDPPLLCEWPAYFQPTDADKATVAKEAREDRQAGHITLKTAVTRIEPFYQDIPQNVDEYVEALEEEAEKKAEEARAAFAELGGSDGGDGGGAQRGGGPGKAGQAGAGGATADDSPGKG